jgi:hypothetical protein
MTPRAVMRLCGWITLVVGALLVCIGIGIVAMSTAGNGFVVLLIGVVGISAGAWWAFHVPSDAELAKWSRRRK